MSKEIKVYTMPDCPYCSELKKRLNNLSIEFIDINVELPENENEFDKLSKYTKSDLLPMIIVGTHVLVGDVSFKTIEEASLIIQKLNS